MVFNECWEKIKVASASAALQIFCVQVFDDVA